MQGYVGYWANIGSWQHTLETMRFEPRAVAADVSEAFEVPPANCLLSGQPHK
jgi:hypothetical protein